MHFSCEDLIEAGFKNDCCSSCHSDEEEGFAELSELYSEDAGIVGAKRTGNLSDYDGDELAKIIQQDVNEIMED